MLDRTPPSLAPIGLVIVVVMLAACGPESMALPPTGVYRFEVATLENECDPHLDEQWTSEEIVEVAADGSTITVPASYAVGYPVDCEECVALAHWNENVTRPAADGSGYVSSARDAETRDDGRCLHSEFFEVEVVDEQRLKARITSEWRESNGCPWRGATVEGCTVVREYTYELIEPCDCEFPLAHRQ